LDLENLPYEKYDSAEREFRCERSSGVINKMKITGLTMLKIIDSWSALFD
jgi:hypothetical protein